LHLLSHPFNALSLTSRRCHELVENYCSHLVRACNGTMFNLPFAQLDKYGPKCVYPDMSGIVYRRLWLQHAPRRCINCWAVLDCYPFTRLKRLLTTCGNCFYRQSLVRLLLHKKPSKYMYSNIFAGGSRSAATIPYIIRHRACLAQHPRQQGFPLGSTCRRRGTGLAVVPHESIPQCAQGTIRQAVFYLRHYALPTRVPRCEAETQPED
jgi:hypothetical protein